MEHLTWLGNNIVSFEKDRNLTKKFQPELIFGLVGPIGVDLDEVQRALTSNLQALDYASHVIHLTQLLPDIASSFFDIREGSLHGYERKISFANRLREETGRDDLLAAIATLQISINRRDENRKSDEYIKSNTPLPHTAFIIRQLKREEELATLRQTYGKRFVQLSIVLDSATQVTNLENKLAVDEPELTDEERNIKVLELIQIDKNQTDNLHGQRFSDAFHTGDVFISGSNPTDIETGIKRFLNAFFGKNDHSPSIDEFGSYIAKGASLRSVDLSRQVGAAILNPEGDLITVGFNDVPKAGGGNYWFDDDPKNRDIDDKFEPNKVETNRMILDF